MVERGRAPGGLTEQTAGAHHAGAVEGDVGGGNQTSGQEQVVQRAAVQAAQRNGVGTFTVELAAAVVGAVNPVRRMQADRPAALGDGIVVVPLLDNILLAQQMVADKVTAFSLAGNGPDPLDGYILRFGKLAGVLM